MRDSQGCSHALLRTLSKQTPASGSYFLQVGYEPACLKSRTLHMEQLLLLARQSRTLVHRAGYPVARTLFRPKHRWIQISSSDSTSSEEVFTQPSRRRQRTLTCDFVIILEPFVLYFMSLLSYLWYLFSTSVLPAGSIMAGSQDLSQLESNLRTEDLTTPTRKQLTWRHEERSLSQGLRHTRHWGSRYRSDRAPPREDQSRHLHSRATVGYHT